MASASVAAALGDPEILGLILKKVRPSSNILVAARVSRLWRKTAHTTCSALEVPTKCVFNEYSMLQCIRHYSQLTSLDISGYRVSDNTPFFLGGLAAAFPKLKDLHLHLDFRSAPIAPDNLKGFLESFPLLERFVYGSRLTRGLPHPQVLSALSCIKVLHVSLGANLPETFYSLTSLQDLTIIDRSAELLTISPSITRLVNLTRLCAQVYTFNELPPSFGVLPSLELLQLTVCRCEGRQGRASLPDLGDLPRLKFLTVSCMSCSLSECDPFIPSADYLRLPASLVFLSFEGLHVSALPEGWEGLPSLQSLTLCGLKNLKEIPSSVGMLKSLEELVVQRCASLRHFPEEIGKMKQLQDLTIKSCPSLESIPKSLKDLSRLKRLRVEDCPKLLRLPWQLEKLIEESAGVK